MPKDEQERSGEEIKELWEQVYQELLDQKYREREAKRIAIITLRCHYDIENDALADAVGDEAIFNSIDKEMPYFKSNNEINFDIPIFKSYMKGNKRIFEGLASGAVKDVQGDMIPIYLLRFCEGQYLDMGAPVTLRHSNFIAGKVIDMEYPELVPGVKGCMVKGEVFQAYPKHDDIWRDIQDKTLAALSVSGEGGSITTHHRDWGSHHILTKFHLYEIALCSSPANPLSFLTAAGERGTRPPAQPRPLPFFFYGKDGLPVLVEGDGLLDPYQKPWEGTPPTGKPKPPETWWKNCKARADKFTDDSKAFCAALWYYGPEGLKQSFGTAYKPKKEGEWDEFDLEVGVLEAFADIMLARKHIEQRANQICVVHCKGGEPIKCWPNTPYGRERAQAMHAAIMANRVKLVAILEGKDTHLRLSDSLLNMMVPIKRQQN